MVGGREFVLTSDDALTKQVKTALDGLQLRGVFGARDGADGGAGEPGAQQVEATWKSGVRGGRVYG